VEQVAPNGVATWTLNRPKARNALSLALLQELRAAQERLLAPKAAAAPTPRVVVVRSTGAVFSSGHDLKELAAMSAADQARVMALCSQVMAGFRALPQPVLAAVDGLATAAGCQLVASCDLVLATRAARFATPGVNIGLFCSTPGVALARAVLPQHAMKMLLTGEPVSAAEAAVMGLVAELVEDAAALDAAVDRIASLLAGKSRATLALGKRGTARAARAPGGGCAGLTTAGWRRPRLADVSWQSFTSRSRSPRCSRRTRRPRRRWWTTWATPTPRKASAPSSTSAAPPGVTREL